MSPSVTLHWRTDCFCTHKEGWFTCQYFRKSKLNSSIHQRIVWNGLYSAVPELPVLCGSALALYPWLLTPAVAAEDSRVQGGWSKEACSTSMFQPCFSSYFNKQSVLQGHNIREAKPPFYKLKEGQSPPSPPWFHSYCTPAFVTCSTNMKGLKNHIVTKQAIMHNCNAHLPVHWQKSMK